MENVNVPRRLTEMPRRDPTNGTFELTVRCNLHCKMCLFRHADCENAELMRNELTAAQWIDMARQAAEAGTFSLLITGGEPMLRPDFCEIWEGIYKQGFVLTLYTNATLVTPEIMETLKKYPPHKIGVTIYGASPETYEKVCGDAKGFQRMLSGVHRLQELPSQMEFRTTIIRDNSGDMTAIDRLVRTEFGDSYFVTLSSHVHKTVRGACGDVTTCRLSPKEMKELHVKRAVEKARVIIGGSFDPNALKFVSRDPSEEEPNECKTTKLSLFGCNAGMSSYTITYDGKLLACQMLGAFSTDAVALGLSEAWKQFPFKVELPPPNPDCVDCELAAFCQSCCASRYAETGRLDGCSDYMRLEAATNRDFYNEHKQED